MKAKIKLTHEVTVIVEKDCEEDIYEWMCNTTPKEAFMQSEDKDSGVICVESTYNEELLDFVKISNSLS